MDKSRTQQTFLPQFLLFPFKEISLNVQAQQKLMAE